MEIHTEIEEITTKTTIYTLDEDQLLELALKELGIEGKAIDVEHIVHRDIFEGIKIKVIETK